jgi:hypothetical protein
MAYLSWKGIYSISTLYQPGDVVSYQDDGVTYVCVKQTQGMPPYLPNSGFEQMFDFNISLIDGGEF